MHLLLLLTTILLPSLIIATTHTISVAEHGLTYTPNTTHAAIGDTITFLFYPSNHNVVQGPFSTPCQSGDNKGVYSGTDFPITTLTGPSGIVGQPSNTTFNVKINDTNPIWFYCSVRFSGGHCTKGMVGVINPPANSTQTLDAYKTAAAKVSNETYSEPEQVQGGVVVLGGGQAGNVTSSSGVEGKTATVSGSGAKSTSYVTETTVRVSSTTTVGVSASSTSASASQTPTATAGAGKMEGRGWGLGALIVGLVVALL